MNLKHSDQSYILLRKASLIIGFMQQQVQTFRSVMIGGSRVGKTQLINKFVNDNFSELHQESSKDAESKEWMHEGKLYLLEAKQIDNSMPEDEINKLLNKSDAIVFVFDLTDIESYDALSSIIEGVCQMDSVNKDIRAIVIGNKSDLNQRAISKEEGETLGKKVGGYIEMSAKTGQNIDKACEILWDVDYMFSICKNGVHSPIYQKIKDDKQKQKLNQKYQPAAPSQCESWNQSAAPLDAKIIHSPCGDLQYKQIIRMAVNGQFSTGKTSIFGAFGNVPFNEMYVPTIGVDFKIITFELRGLYFKIQLWDLAGQERFRAITACYHKAQNVMFLIYDITNQASFERIKSYHTEAIQYSNHPNSLRFILVGNKSDLTQLRVVPREAGEKLAEELKCPFFEVSAKTGDGIETCLLAAIDSYFHR